MSGWRWVRLGAVCVALIAGFASTGCKAVERNPDDLLPPANVQPVSEMPSVREMIRRYNARLVGVETLFARTKVELVWADRDGELRRESGGGVLMLRLPLDTAVTVEKFGQTVMWAGSNLESYWLFSDLHDEGELVYGRFGGLGSARLPLPVSPELIPVLLGLTPLPAFVPGADAPAESLRGFALIEPPGLGVRLLLEPETGRPVRVDLLDASGRSEVVCVLEGALAVHRPEVPKVFVEGGELVNPGVGPAAGRLVPVGDAPEGPLRLPARLTMYPVGDPSSEETRLTLELERASLADRRVRDRLFDLGVLVETHRPQRVVDLDAVGP